MYSFSQSYVLCYCIYTCLLAGVRCNFFFFFLNETATTVIYTSGHTLPLHDARPCSPAVDAVPAWSGVARGRRLRAARPARPSGLSGPCGCAGARAGSAAAPTARSAPGCGRRQKIGRASCRERVCPYGLITVVAVSIKKKYKTLSVIEDNLNTQSM